MIAEKSATGTLLSERIIQCLAEMPGVALVTENNQVKPLYTASGYVTRVDAETYLEVKSETRERGLRLFSRFFGLHRPVIGRKSVRKRLEEQLHVSDQSWSFTASPLPVSNQIYYQDLGSDGKGFRPEDITNLKYDLHDLNRQRFTPNVFASEKVYIRVK